MLIFNDGAQIVGGFDDHNASKPSCPVGRRGESAPGANRRSGNILQTLRDLGANKIEGIRAIRMVKGCSLGEAKDEVHFSAAWGERRASDEAFHESVFQAIEQIQREGAAAGDTLERLAS